ncbi:NAD-dependent epimerase/dehydratase family protein [Parvibium lacunae]|uniref:NAD-dependent epimerase/dehydratase family protein n=2 Tax=Parvibium lacunae TaxID=1888893 RepID=A0A368L1J4_9BURK|nr:NAD-dependent epimerase/dehydratase family protein [Parvibium lacunae]
MITATSPRALGRILLIGGGGFIGSHLANRLAADHHAVTIMGRSRNLSDTARQILGETVENINYISGDFTHTNFLREILVEHDTVVSLAYATVPNTAFENPLLDLQQNLVPSISLFEEMARLRKLLVIISSGGTVYGRQTGCIDENHKTHPISPYGLTKLTIEHYANLYAITHGLQHLILRPSNAYGVGQLPYRGQGFIANVIANILTQQPIILYGDGSIIRDYIAIDDLSLAIQQAMLSAPIGETYNIGSGVGISSKDILNKLVRLCGLETCTINYLPARVFDVPSNILSSAKLHAAIGWQPHISLEVGLSKTLEWQKTQLGSIKRVT